MKILIKRDTLNNFNSVDFIPREYELVAAYDEETSQVIYKLGDGATPWADLKEITKISELDKFIIYGCKERRNASGKIILKGKQIIGPEVYINPFLINKEFE